MSPVPPAILRALSLPLDASKSSLSTSGLGSGFASTGRIRARVPLEGREDEEEEREYFVKTSPTGQEMFRGEYESLNAIASTVPGFCPRALAHGELDNGKGYFLVTEFLDLSGGRLSSSRTKANSLAQRLGKLHSTPAPLVTVTEESADGGSPRQVRKPMFGFPVATYCGDTRQPNRFRASWAEFFAEERLLTILAESERRNGRDPALRELVQRTVDSVVPALLRDGHLGGEKGITPVVVHGDLWSGNASTGRIVRPRKVGGGGMKDGEDEVGAVVYDPSACYAHSEYELGIMRMFGGFGKAFFDEYHAIVPKTEPVEEYNDRVTLYELYHHLNHHAIFGGGYRSGAVSIMQSLLRKYEK
ncbi:hypothetical protein VTN31DRAFT_2275 [Thermomyces dupontii]|uniref:uncharacterized protein n=1 Tax=Talaromyces thermophilus TaxID=28565 RepID=UPI003743E7F5